MRRYLAVRLGQGVLVIFGAITISFVLASVSGNPVDARYTNASVGVRNQLIHQYGYDRPLLTRYVSYVGGVVHGDFGRSLGDVAPPLSRVADALPYTLLLVAGATLVASLAAIGVGTLAVLRRASRLEVLTRRGLMVLQGIPEFFAALVLVLVFAVGLGWLPSFGVAEPRSFILPIVALALPLLSTLTRLVRAQLLDILGMDFVTALRAKGLAERDIVLRHAMRNAAPPLITYLALQVGWLLGGTIIVEVVFGIPGIGSLAVAATRSRDLPVVQAVVVTVAVGYVVLNLAADAVVLAIDPRARRKR
jgi:ABC-type dipeptide/oligopeptide/nickel transport system permease component